jgi:hypothetical protein
MAIQDVFSVAAAQSWIRRYVDTLVYGKYNQLITNVATNRPIFFAKMKKNSTAIFNLRIDGPSMSGTICMAVSVGETNNLSHSSLSILSTSVPAFFNGSTVYLATSIDGLISDYIFVGFSVITTGTFDVNMQAVSSERRGVVGVAYSVSLSTVPNVTFPVSDGYLAGYPLIKPIRSLDAFHRWSATYQYEAEDPTFFNGSAYFANPAAIPNIGESPSTHPGKWIQLARPDSGPLDLTEGARTPQLFYGPGLIISNTTAVKLRKAHQDQGMQYLSAESKVYHLDGDLLDQDQQNPLTVILGNPELSNNVIPHFISEDSGPEQPITTDPAIPKKPFKEVAEAYFGSYSILLIMPDGDGQNTLDYWFKPVEGGVLNIFFVRLPTGELFDLSLGYEEPFWNDNSGVEGSDNFPFNENVLLPGTVVYNERSISADMHVIQSFNGEVVITPITFSSINLPQLNKWSHIALEIGNDSITIFLNGQQQTVLRISSGFGGNTEININPKQIPIVLDEIMLDWATSISFARFSEVSITRLPWAYHEWKDGWLTLYVDNPDEFDSNLVMHFFPVGSVMTQTTTSGVYDNSQTPWIKFHNFRQEQFVLQGEVTPTGGNGEKTRFWQRIS